MKLTLKSRSAFTLIELLIVVAIIAILAAIAVPNFLEAQMRAKVARVKSDMRTIGMALESYSIDSNGQYPNIKIYRDIPTLFAKWGQDNRGGIMCVTNLTTPVAYLSSVRFPDPFCKFTNSGDPDYGGVPTSFTNGDDINVSLVYINVKKYWKDKKQNMTPAGRGPWLLCSLGPDYKKGPNPKNNGNWLLSDYAENKDPGTMCHYDAWNYDPSNGSTSGGDILRLP